MFSLFAFIMYLWCLNVVIIMFFFCKLGMVSVQNPYILVSPVVYVCHACAMRDLLILIWRNFIMELFSILPVLFNQWYEILRDFMERNRTKIVWHSLLVLFRLATKEATVVTLKYLITCSYNFCNYFVNLTICTSVHLKLV